MTPSETPFRMVSRCVRELRLFFVAMQFFTRLPVPGWVGYSPEWLNHASRYFSAVGVVVGTLATAVYFAAAQCWAPSIAVLISTAVSLYLTGGLHEDGFADVCDGFGGGYTADRVLEIMKDSRIGAFGAMGLLMMLALKCTALANADIVTAAAALWVAHPLSRALATVLIWRMPYAKAEGKAKPLAQEMTACEFAISACTAIVVILIAGSSGFLPWRALLAAAVMALCAAWWLAKFFRKRIGGYTGDCLGAVQQVCEVAFYLGVTGFL